jgi:large subunit ribosomal protein L25
MSEIQITAEVREKFGKGAARKLRAAGHTPAVIYGHGNATRHISLPAHQIALALRKKNALLQLTTDGKTELVLVKSASKDPVTQIIEHVDLVMVTKGEKVTVEVPVHVIGEAMGGTIVDLEHKSVKLEAEATNIPAFVELHISRDNSDGHHYLVGELVVPKGAVLELEASELLATVIETKGGAASDTEVVAEATETASPAAE